jgi:hypothetical protein
LSFLASGLKNLHEFAIAQKLDHKMLQASFARETLLFTDTTPEEVVKSRFAALHVRIFVAKHCEKFSGRVGGQFHRRLQAPQGKPVL